MYNRINDKLVGLLIRARKHDLLEFEGEMLYQGRDDETWVVLKRSINTIHAYFGRDPTVPGGGEVDPSFQTAPLLGTNSRRTSNTSIASLPADVPLLEMKVNSPNEEHPDMIILDPSSSRSSMDKSSANNLTAPHSTTKSKLTSKGIKASFRKLVKPLVRKRDPAEGDHDPDEDDLPSMSRRGSRFSHMSDSVTGFLAGEAKEARHSVETRWKKVLGVTLAIGR